MSASTKKTWLCLSCCVFLLGALAAGASFWEPGEISQQRVRIAKALLREYYQRAGLEQSREQAAVAVFNDFSSHCGQLAARATDVLLTEQDVLAASEKILLQLSREAIPFPSDKELAKESEGAYPLYKPGDRVVVVYMPNPQYPAAVEGIYQGKLGSVIRVGNSRIRLHDMLQVENNEAEVLKFDPVATERLRKEWIMRRQHELHDSRQQYEKKHEAVVKAQQRALFCARNERAGYTFYQDEWLEPMALLQRAASQIRGERQRALAQQTQRTWQQAIRAIEDQASSEFMKALFSPDHERSNPEETLIALQKSNADQVAGQQRASAEEKARAQAALEKARQKAVEDARLAAAAQAQQSGAAADAGPAAAAEGKEITLMSPQLVLGVALAVVLLALGAWVFYSRHQRQVKNDTFKKFFDGKGKLQKDFWEQADADPDHFKYVAYMFPSIADANRALQKLSYIQVSGSGDLKCARDIHFGVYPHLEGAVAFVGGTKFTYALWREASAMMPEEPGAVYFKVSTEPFVSLDIPDIEKLASDSDLHIENLGVEELAGEDGFIRCYKYRTETKDAALAFLSDIEVNEEGISIQVETPEGVFGKDENGVYTA